MYKSSSKYLFCVKCNGRSALKVLKGKEDVEEGFLVCKNCSLTCPIINGIPILWNDFTNYLANRPSLGGHLLLCAKTTEMKSFIKYTLGKIHKNPNDVSIIEKRWCCIYLDNQRSRFYSKIKKQITKNHGIALEHGCSIGTMTRYLAKNYDFVFGIDKSYHAIFEAKKQALKNLDYVVADSLEHPFGRTKFDFILALNLFELVEPKKLLRLFARQLRKGGVLFLSDPYDYERGTRSVKEPLFADSLRHEIKKHGFVIDGKTKRPSFFSWDLRLYERANLHYDVDFVIAKKI